MNVSSPMYTVVRFGRKPHPIDTAKYGRPRLALYYAARDRFVRPGLHLWTGKRNVWILPLPPPVSRIRRGFALWRCTKLGWHPKRYRHMIRHDGASAHVICGRCGFVGMEDSQGNLF